MYFLFFFICEVKKKRKYERKEKNTPLFSTSSRRLYPRSAVFFIWLRQISYVRYCATHALTISPHPSPPPLGRKEYAEHCLKGEAQNVGWAFSPTKTQPNVVRMMRTIACFLFLYSTFFWGKYFNLEY